MKKLPVYFIDSPNESYSIIEQDKERQKEFQGGRAEHTESESKQLDPGSGMSGPVAMTPPFLCEPRPKAVKADNESFDEATAFEAACRDHGLETPAAPQAQVPQSQEPRPYFGQENFEPQYVLQKEEPQHRIICYLAAAGNTNTEIAEKTGFTTAMVSYVKKQPWAQKAIAEIQEREGRKGVMNVLQGAALAAAQRLIAVAEGTVPGSKVSDSVNSAKEILNRCYGTAPQVILSGKVDANELSDDELVAAMQGN